MRFRRSKSRGMTVHDKLLNVARTGRHIEKLSKMTPASPDALERARAKRTRRQERNLRHQEATTKGADR